MFYHLFLSTRTPNVRTCKMLRYNRLRLSHCLLTTLIHNRLNGKLRVARSQQLSRGPCVGRQGFYVGEAGALCRPLLRILNSRGPSVGGLQSRCRGLVSIWQGILMSMGLKSGAFCRQGKGPPCRGVLRRGAKSCCGGLVSGMPRTLCRGVQSRDPVRSMYNGSINTSADWMFRSTFSWLLSLLLFFFLLLSTGADFLFLIDSSILFFYGVFMRICVRPDVLLLARVGTPLLTFG